MTTHESLELYSKWNQITGDMLADNVTAMLNEKGFRYPEDQVDALIQAVHATLEDAFHWLQHGKDNWKIPFEQLFAIAEAFEADPQRLLVIAPVTYKRQFAVLRIIDNDVTVLKLFDEQDKAGAIAYGEEVAKTNQDGVITVERTRFDKHGNWKGGSSEIFRVW